ncbi:MAG TPA: BrnT family toxin [Terracidiphilus sp.]|nr:BrnT family toxin [Terracidiphilus sp.]
MSFEWDPEKAEINFRKHGVRFAEAEPVFGDDFALTIVDDESDPNEQRFVSIGMGVKERVLVVVYCHRGSNIRIISARLAEAHERAQYEEHR